MESGLRTRISAGLVNWDAARVSFSETLDEGKRIGVFHWQASILEVLNFDVLVEVGEGFLLPRCGGSGLVFAS